MTEDEAASKADEVFAFFVRLAKVGSDRPIIGSAP
jgi:hypothetical protein